MLCCILFYYRAELQRTQHSLQSTKPQTTTSGASGATNTSSAAVQDARNERDAFKMEVQYFYPQCICQ